MQGFQCGLCEALMEEPATLGCQHSFCRSCILGRLGVRGQSDCPAEGCGKKYYRHTLNEPSPVQQEIDVLLRRCIQGVSWDCSRRCYKHVQGQCSYVGSKQAVASHQRECPLRPVGLALMEGGEQIAVPYKDLPAVVRERLPERADQRTGDSINAGATFVQNRRVSAGTPARRKMTSGRVPRQVSEASVGNRDAALQQRATREIYPQAPCSGAQVVAKRVQIVDNQGRHLQHEGLARQGEKEKIEKPESDKRELKRLWEREAKSSKRLEVELQQAATQHAAALAKGARVHKQKERAWASEKVELLVRLETQADKLSSVEERFRQGRLESPLANEGRRLEEAVAGWEKKYWDRRNEWKAEKEGLETELADARADAESNRKDAERAQKELERVRRVLQQERRDLERVRRVLERAEKDEERLCGVLKRERRDLERVRGERTELRLKQTETSLGVGQLERDLNDKIALVRERDEKIVQLKAALSNETTLVEQRGEEVAQLKAALRGKERERDSLRGTLGKAKELCERVDMLEAGLERGQCAQGDAWFCVVEEAKGLFSNGPEAGDEDLRRKRRRH
ncbi:hypothetical protein KFL_002580190 [Klebsormidium nitens]|uniref:RING-type domain-containing protein n=1 Tax=Klebsormidium nitens TaxID=105231 RepID=A0A1Y1I8Y2_KLENI|nr:hypothetical protein KFL_002580190 [Klebsormidium nitens]|eukprot:GAQ85869.1 hypothetical protein KFL_002580190 [Klebsormidium nitens]